MRHKPLGVGSDTAAAVAAKSLQSCPTLCDRIDSSPPRLRKNTGVGRHFLLQCTKVKSESEVAQSYPTLRDPMDCSLPGSSVHGIFQARVLEWGAIAFSMVVLVVKNLSINEGDIRNNLLKQATLKKNKKLPVLLPGKSHGQRSLVGCSPWGRWKSGMTERLHFHFSLSCTGEGNGNPLQCSCLEKPRDGGAWWAAVCGVA